MVCMGAALSLVAVTARGTQTAGVEEEEDTRKCKNLRALCRFLCTRPSGTTCWRAMLHRVVILGTASLVSTGLSLLVSNLTADDPESMRTTIRVIVAEVLGLGDQEERNKREAECFTTNDSDVRCPPLNPTTSACSVGQLLHTQRDSILPPTCSMTLAIIVFTTMAGVLLSITTAATIICRNIRRVQMDVQMTQTDATPFATPDSSVHGSKVENLEEEEGETGHRLTNIPGDSPA